MLLLAIDTAATQAAASVFDAEQARELGRAVEPMRTGHAERLMAVIADALDQAGKRFSNLNRIAVSVGPGSFTGARVGVATARGLALALGVPAVGVSTLEALAAEARSRETPRAILVALDGGRETVFAAAYHPDGRVLREAAALTPGQTIDLAREFRPLLVGSAAQPVAAALPELFLPIGPLSATADIAFFARLGAQKPADAKPKPLYLRAPDAKPQAGFILPRRG